MSPERPVRPINLADPGHRPPRRRRALLAVAVVAAVALGALGFVFRGPLGRGASDAAGGIGDGAEAVWEAWSGWATSLQDRAAGIPEPPNTTTLPPPPPVESRSVFLVIGDDAGAAFALLVRPPEGAPHLVMVPQTLLVQVPGYGEFTMAEALAFGGPGLARLAFANQTGLRIDDTSAVEDLDGLGDRVEVDVPVELFVVEADGSRRLITAGTQRLESDLVELLLVEPGTGDQFDWLRRQEAAWEGILARIAEEPSAAGALVEGAADAAEAAGILEALAADPVIGTPPVDRVAMGGSRDALVLAAEQIGDYLTGAVGHLVIRHERPRVEILNGNGVAGSAVPVAEALVAEGFYVFRTGNADRFDYAATQVIAQGEEAADAAREAAQALGAGDVLLEARAPSLVVDLSIIVGTDLASTEG